MKNINMQQNLNKIIFKRKSFLKKYEVNLKNKNK